MVVAHKAGTIDDVLVKTSMRFVVARNRSNCGRDMLSAISCDSQQIKWNKHFHRYMEKFVIWERDDESNAVVVCFANIYCQERTSLFQSKKYPTFLCIISVGLTLARDRKMFIWLKKKYDSISILILDRLTWKLTEASTSNIYIQLLHEK